MTTPAAPAPRNDRSRFLCRRCPRDKRSRRWCHELARRFETGTRRLQRIFAEYVGASPKWVIRRYRMQDAAAKAGAGKVAWARLAADLGYSDQAHFSRDFAANVGVTPSEYSRMCAAGPSS
jgi:AraC-like DNA-binding protein